MKCSFQYHFFRAIAKHMSPPARHVKRSAVVAKPADKGDLFKTQELIISEQQNVMDLLNVTMKSAPDMLGKEAIKKGKSGRSSMTFIVPFMIILFAGSMKVCTRAQNKVLEYYQEILWGEVGNFLEHIILWWGSSPLAARPPKSSQHLREWINHFVPSGAFKK